MKISRKEYLVLNHEKHEKIEISELWRIHIERCLSLCISHQISLLWTPKLLHRKIKVLYILRLLHGRGRAGVAETVPIQAGRSKPKSGVVPHLTSSMSDVKLSSSSKFARFSQNFKFMVCWKSLTSAGKLFMYGFCIQQNATKY